MKINELISELQHIATVHGNIETQLQDDGKGETGLIVGHETFFVVPEEYEMDGEEETVANLRWWPY